MALVEYAIGDGVAVLTLNRPQALNALNTALLAELDVHLDRIEADDSRAFVITGAGRAFCVGSDLKEGGGDPEGRIRHMHGLMLRMHGFPKLGVAAITGYALGGGLEVAMGCHFRIADPGAQFGQPEIKLGLMPAYGATQTLPRLIGESRALDLMLSGDPIDAATALAQGLLDEVADDPVAAAVRRANDIASGRLPWRRTAELAVPDAELADALRARYLDVAGQAFPGREAGPRAVELILAAATVPFEQGCEAERERFAQLAAGPQARALLHLFFAERALAKAADAPDAATRTRIARRLRAAGEPVPPYAAWTQAARACLAEGLAPRAEFIDVIAVKDCGFPALSGGPLHHAGPH